MSPLAESTLEFLWHDNDAREERLRAVASERLAECPPPPCDEHVVATYFMALRTKRLDEAAEDISYHATSGIHHPPPDSLLAQCTGRCAGYDAWDASSRLGLLHMAYPLKMLAREDGSLSSCDLLHTVAGAILFDVYENLDCRLLRLTIPDAVVRTFPGPAYGPQGMRELAGLGQDDPAFGTILKPTAGITADDVGRLVEQTAGHPLLAFIKEDENLYPRLPYSPVAERTKRAVEAIGRAADRRGGKGLIFAPHVSGGPHEIVDTVLAVLEAGATGVMFSETFAGGTVRLIRDATRRLAKPPVIYGHNAGIGVKTRTIWREVIDLLARLDGIDFRQTAPVRPGAPFLRPYGEEWHASEHALSHPIPGIKPVTVVRAGSLDQGNIILNLQDAADREMLPGILFLAGSAINSVKNGQGRADPHLGVSAMSEAVDVFRSGAMRDVPAERHVTVLKELAKERRLSALAAALHQRYPE